MFKLQLEKFVPHRGLWSPSSELTKIRHELKQNITKLNFRDVRRTRIPLANALLQELYENGCTKFAQFFETILEKEDHLYANKMTEYRLSEQAGLEKMLYENFLKAERALRIEANLSTCFATVFETARLIELNYVNYEWLAKECYELGLSLFAEHKDTASKEQEARFRYFYGRFCLEKLHAYSDAIEQLHMANMLSRKMFWSTTEDSVDYLCKDSCYFLAKSYLAEANRIFKSQIDVAKEKSYLATVCLVECNASGGAEHDRELYIEANLRHCQYLIRSAEYEASLKVHANIQKLIYASGNAAAKCELFLQEGICFMGMNNQPIALRKLQKSIELAEIHKLCYFKGLALVEIAKIYSHQSVGFEMAQISLNEAANIFECIGDAKNLKKVQYFMAILKTQQILPGFIKLMRNANTKKCAMLQLCKWKDNVEPFWMPRTDLPDNIGNSAI